MKNNTLLKNLRNRLLILCMTITSLVMLSAFAAVYLTMKSSIESENSQKVSSAQGSVTMSFEEGDSQSDISGANIQSQQIAYEGDADSFMISVDAQGTPTNMYNLGVMSEQEYIQACKLAMAGEESVIEIGGRSWIYAVSPVSVITQQNGQTTSYESEDEFNITFLDITDSLKTLSNLLKIFIAVGIATLLVILLLSLIFANRAIKPVAEAWERQRRFVADASHELKTPLAIITANYDALLANKNETIESQTQWFDYMKIGTDRMSRLIDELLRLEQSEDASFRSESLDFTTLVQESLQAFEAMLMVKSLSVTTQLEPGVTVTSDQVSLTQLLSILLENAVKYSEIGDEIEVRLHSTSGRAICKIINGGAQIPDVELSQIFDRFYRSDVSRSGDTGGYGLGLSIAKSICDKLGAKLGAQNLPSGRICFELEI